MKVLFLGPSDSPLIGWLRAEGEYLFILDTPLTHSDLDALNPDFIVSYGYKHILPKDIIDRYRGKIINLHISYLPYNRGADPNLWSILDCTPTGVTIHYIDEGIDTGDILLQELVGIYGFDTLKTSYDRLHEAIQNLFKDFWILIKHRVLISFKQVGKGSYHNKADKDKLGPFVLDENKTIKELESFAADLQAGVNFINKSNSD